MKHETRLSEEQQQTAAEQLQARKVREFAGPEELLRFDAAQTPVPPDLARRLRKSTAGQELAVAPSRSSWWRRIFGA